MAGATFLGADVDPARLEKRLATGYLDRRIDDLDRAIDAAVAAAATAEGVSWRKEIVNRERAGGTERMLRERRQHPLIQTAIDAHRFVGIPLPAGREAEASGSTDANAGVVRGVPSISVGRSYGGDQHTLREWAHWPSALPASKMVLLLAVAMTDAPAPPAPPLVP
jgi:hypothetical protein